ncbi:hypothetical protein MAPG_11513 [Magnaporthiopsis poae ATCC 64411]|uniref:Protein-lysine N-methyltransferase EFM5 n=1 Tax=Magnaporthiopsis poae (strain ATCC 64411 / 73-15) TaxID=644358 RepID=A0A0C4EFG6_MAGP6|nr:hypothetical protein MAPG_11513 [Magnaporthiopsis poae ATCC 64411]
MGLSEDFDDEPITLSSHALDALTSFYADRDALKAKFEDLRDSAERRQEKPLSIAAFAEDWQESQFWYSDETASTIAEALLDGCTENSTIAAVSAPSVFVALKNALAARGEDEPKPRLVLLEHDSRFAVFPEYVFYDCNQPLKLPDDLKGACDRIACDPPFLNEDCQTKEATTIQWLARPRSQSPNDPSPAARVVLCTGERMQDLVTTTRLYGDVGGLRTTTFRPQHASKLSNDFYCYANFECTAWQWRD